MKRSLKENINFFIWLYSFFFQRGAPRNAERNLVGDNESKGDGTCTHARACVCVWCTRRDASTANVMYLLYRLRICSCLISWQKTVLLKSSAESSEEQQLWYFTAKVPDLSEWFLLASLVGQSMVPVGFTRWSISGSCWLSGELLGAL